MRLGEAGTCPDHRANQLAVERGRMLGAMGHSLPSLVLLPDPNSQGGTGT